MRIPAVLFAASSLLVTGVVLGAGLDQKTLIYNYDGQASVIRHKKTLLADYDMAIQNGDLIRTEADGVLDLSMNQVAGVRILPKSAVLVKNVNPSLMQIYVESGNLHLHLKEPTSGGIFVAETKAVEVRSNEYAEYALSVKSEPGKPSVTTVSVNKGNLDVYSKEASVTMRIIEGRAIDVPDTSTIPPIRLATDEEKLELKKILAIYVAEAD